jgi:hypothetical protein
MFKVILLIIGAWIFLKLLFNFIIPVYRASKEVRRQFDAMNNAARQNMNQQETPPQETRKEKYTPKGDYIEFEEVK